MVLTQDMRRLLALVLHRRRADLHGRVGASRFAERRDRRRRAVGARPHRRGARVIVGAGRTGRSLMRELRETAGERVLGFVDDNPRLRRRRDPRRPGARRARRAAPRARAHRAGHRARDDPGRAARAARRASSRRAPRRASPCRFVRREIDLDPRVVLGIDGRVNATVDRRRRRRRGGERDDAHASSTALFAAFPIVGIALAVLIFYGVEAWLRKTPWVFTDELEWTQISRAIAETGHAARRGEPIFFKTLYAVPDRAVLVDPLDRRPPTRRSST